MSVRHPGSHLIVGLAPDTDFDASRMWKDTFAKVAAYEQDRANLMEAAKVGNAAAAKILWERWHFRWTE